MISNKSTKSKDDSSDERTFTVTGNAGANTVIVVTLTDTTIVSIGGTTVNFSTFDEGQYLVWAATFDGGLSGAEPGADARDL